MNTFAAADAVDLGIASSELEAGRKMLAAAHALADRQLRTEAIKTAVAKLALASRAIDMVVDRRRDPSTKTRKRR